MEGFSLFLGFHGRLNSYTRLLNRHYGNDSFHIDHNSGNIQDKGVYVFMKHFALNDQETHRAGVMVWANEQAIREAYLAAYAPAVTESHAKGAMTIMNRIRCGGHSAVLDFKNVERTFD